MFILNQNTSKRELLEFLTQSANSHDDLYLEIESLPIFLNTEVAFTVFNYQISNYPRNIIWTSNEESVLEYLKDCGARVQSAKSIEESNAQAKTTILSVSSVANSSEFNPVAYLPDLSKQRQPISAKSLLTQEEYQPSSLLEKIETVNETAQEEQNTQKQQPVNNSGDFQNLDIWLQRIETTKSALDMMKGKVQAFQQNNSNEEQSKYVKNIKPASNKIFNLFVTASVFSAFFVAFLVLFPTKVYTVELQPTTVEDGLDLQIDKQQFSKKEISLQSSSSTTPSGQKEVQTDRSFGRVSLVNNGSREVDLNNGLFKLLKDGKEYQAITNNTLPKSFSIPARNSSTGRLLEFDIQAKESGSQYNLPDNTQLEIVNLLNQRVCSGCYAVTITEIKNTSVTGDKVVTEADYALLKNNVESEFARNRQSEMDQIQTDITFTNQNWFKNTDSNYSFNQSIGQPVPKLELSAQVSSTIYFLNRENLENIVKETNPEIKKILDLVIISYTGSFDTEENLQLKVYFNYQKEFVCLTKEQFLETLKTESFETAQQNIKKQCPDVKNIQRKDLGVSMPGVPAKIDLNLLEPVYE